MKALLMGKEPPLSLGYEYVRDGAYDAVVIGSLELSELLRFRNGPVLEALAAGKTVLLYTPGLPESPRNRAVASSLASAQRELKSWGVVFTDGGRKRLVTAQEARAMKNNGRMPEPGAVMTPLAKEILGGLE